MNDTQAISFVDEKIKEMVVEAVTEAMESFNSLDRDAETFLTEKEAAELLRVKPQTMAVWRYEARGPTYRKHGSRVVYSKSSLLAYSEKNSL